MEKETALIIIDMQVGVFDGLVISAVSGSEELLSNVTQLVEKARQAAIPVVFIQHNGEEGHPLEQGTDGWHIHPDLGVTGDDIVVQKHTPDSFYNTDLQAQLISDEIKRLVIAGIQTEYCIDTTCRRAFSLGYEVILVKNAHSTWDTDQFSSTQIIDHHNSLLNEWFVTLKEVNEIDFNS